MFFETFLGHSPFFISQIFHRIFTEFSQNFHRNFTEISRRVHRNFTSFSQLIFAEISRRFPGLCSDPRTVVFTWVLPWPPKLELLRLLLLPSIIADTTITATTINIAFAERTYNQNCHCFMNEKIIKNKHWLTRTVVLSILWYASASQTNSFGIQ